jgi:hypothetical protein
MVSITYYTQIGSFSQHQRALTLIFSASWVTQQPEKSENLRTFARAGALVSKPSDTENRHAYPIDNT